MENKELLKAVDSADAAMMEVVKLLCEQGDTRSKLAIDLQAEFCAPFQYPAGSFKTTHAECACDRSDTSS